MPQVTGTLFVNNADGTRTPAGTFTFVPAPTVSSVTPSSGPSAGGTVVHILGADFQQGSKVFWDGPNGTSVEWPGASIAPDGSSIVVTSQPAA